MKWNSIIKKGLPLTAIYPNTFPPEQDISAKGYINELNKLFPEVIYKETTGGIVSKPSNTETVTLPKAQWHEAFFMAQRLFDFPKEYTFSKSKREK